MEYSKNNWTTSAELEKKGEASLGDFSFDSLDLGLSYKYNGKTNLGLWTSSSLSNYDTTVTAGLQNKLSDVVSVKAKVNTDKDVELFGKYQPCDYFSVAASILTSVDARRNSELYNNGAKFGLKVKFDN